MGDGVGSGEMASLRLTLPITEITRQNDQVAVRTVLSLMELQETFYWRELGVTAKDPDSGEEVLYAYGSSMEGDLISHSGTLTEKQIAVVLMVQNEMEVSATIDESLIYAKKKMLEEFKEKAWAEFSCTKSGTVFALTGDHGTGIVQGVFTAPAAFAAGDSFTVNGIAFTVQLQNGEEAKDNFFISGAVVNCVLDTENKTVNFKSSGGSIKYATGTVSYSSVYNGLTVTNLGFKPYAVIAYQSLYQSIGIPTFIALNDAGTKVLEFQALRNYSSYIEIPTKSGTNTVNDNGFTVKFGSNGDYGGSGDIVWHAWGI